MNDTRRTGFTLIELMAVIGIIGLLAALVLPSAARLFSASSDEQARQMLSASLTGARVKAIENAEYRLVHVQMGKDGWCWVASMARSGVGPVAKFGSEGILMAHRLPGRVAFGGIADRFLVPAGDEYKPNLTDAELEDFTSFNIGFGPDGQVVTGIGALPFMLDGMSPVFGWTKEAIWQDCPPFEWGVRAVTYFSYPEVKVLPATGPAGTVTRTMHLNDNSQFLALNPLTGRVMDPE